MAVQTVNQPNPLQQNAAARQLIKAKAVKRIQQIYSQTVNPSTSPNLVLNVQPQNVGLGLGFFVEVTASIKNNDGVNAITPSDFGPANIFSQITFTDYQNVQRIQTPGWHLYTLNSLTRKRPFGSAFKSSSNDNVTGMSNNWDVISATASIASAATGTIKIVYWVPLAYNEQDLRGALYMNVTNAVASLQLAFNQSLGAAASTDDTTNAVYVGSTSVACTSATVTVYQVYYDQLFLGNNGRPILPMLDLSTIYQMNQTAFSGIVQGQDFPMQFANLRDFISEVAIVNNGDTATGHGGRQVGSDINYFGLQTANASWIFKNDPYLQALKTRQVLGTDLPYGCYYFSQRDKVISLKQYGNMQLVANLSTVGNTIPPYILLGYEYFSFTQTIMGAGSLAAS